jgi:hypothetical protein
MACCYSTQEASHGSLINFRQSTVLIKGIGHAVRPGPAEKRLAGRWGEAVHQEVREAVS